MGGTGDGGQGVIISYETHTHIHTPLGSMGGTGDKGLSYHMRHTHTHTHTHTFRVYGGDRGQGLRVYWGDRGQGLGGTGVRVYGGDRGRGTRGYHII